ncbi:MULTISPECIES: extracellular solute-binding protein [unclassified Paenibacillus]|uniref:extracellular solute-binding protein n=1 Tax=unclassified Paenibacillus TaxID=185978 RepID=UPI00083834D6|nr:MULTISPECIES: extracellular solute-binding protein [unclassified Paenibacillus]NWL87629.1 ABC transporter substrate-binding protein [Paenibacillus sp. 79R4]
MKKRSKLIVNVLSVLMIVALLAGCSGKGGNTAQEPNSSNAGNTQEQNNAQGDGSGLYELGKEPLNITLYGNYDWYTMPKWGEEPTTKWVQENKKVTVTEIPNGGNTAQKLNTMIASGELPDIIWGERGADVERLREAGLLVPLDDYIDKYPNLKKWIDPVALKMLRSPDGKLYQFPNWYTNRPNGNAGWVVNKKIYKELGEPKLETTDDLYAYLKQVKEKFPNVVPFETDLAAEGHGLDQIYSAFKEDNFTFTRFYAVPDGDNMKSIYKDEPFRESVVYAAKLFREGLMTQDAMTQTRDQVDEKLINGRVAVYASANPTVYAMTADAELRKKDPQDGYFMVWPIHKEGLDKNKIYPGTYNKLGWNAAVITTSAKNPEAVFAFLDWWTGPEGTTLQFWGLEGEYWQGYEEDGYTPKFTEKYVTQRDQLTKYQTDMDPIMWVGNTVFADDTKGKYESTLAEDERNWATYWQYQITWKTQGDATQFVNMSPMPDSEEGIAYQRARDIWLQVRAQTLYAKTDDEVLALLDKAYEDTMSAGFDKVLAYYVNKWNENKAVINGN